MIYTLVGSVKLCGVDPQAYLRHVLDRVANHASNQQELVVQRVQIRSGQQPVGLVFRLGALDPTGVIDNTDVFFKLAQGAERGVTAPRLMRAG